MKKNYFKRTCILMKKNYFNQTHYKNEIMKKNFKPLTPYPIIGTPMNLLPGLFSVQNTTKIGLAGLGQ